MNSTLLRQPGFTGGELAPVSQGRTESEAYKYGLRTALNFIPTAEGHLLNRPGTRYVCAVKDSTYTPRLISFVFADGQTFILEIGDKYIRFIQNGAQVETAPGSGIPYEVVSPWAIADVMRLDFAQSGDVIGVRCIGPTGTQYQPYEITRLSNTNWTVTAVSYSGTVFGTSIPMAIGVKGIALNTLASFTQGQHGAAVVSKVLDIWSVGATFKQGQFVLYDLGTHYGLYQAQFNLGAGTVPTAALPSDWADWTYDASHTYDAGDYIWYSTTHDDGHMFVSTAAHNFGHIPNLIDENWWALAVDTSRQAKPFQVVFTAVVKDTAGRVTETLASSPSYPTDIAIATDRSAAFTLKTSGVGPFTGTIQAFNVYGGRNGIYGYLGTTAAPGSATSMVFIYDGTLQPDFGHQPPRGTNPFDVSDGVGGVTESWPGAFAYHEQRAVEGRTSAKPSDFWGSAIGQYKNFDVNFPVQDSDAFNFRPASERLEDIRHFLSLRYLLIFTGSGVWGAYGPSGEITPSGIYLRRYNNNGASFLPPLGVDRTALYLTDRNRVLDLNWDWRSDMYVSRDVSIIARHLVEGYVINDWCYAQTPYGMIWSVRNDGTLLSMTYQPGGIEAWARHNTVGIFERVTSVPEPIDGSGAFEDAVYVVVKRYCEGLPVRYIERFDSRVLPTMQVAAQPSRTVDGVTKSWDGATWRPVDSYTNGFDTDPTAGEIATALAMPNVFKTDVRLCNFIDASLEYDGRTSSNHALRVNSATHPGSTDPADYAAGSQVTIIVQDGTPIFVAGDEGYASVVFDIDGLSPVTAMIVGYVNDHTVIAELAGSFTLDQVARWTAGDFLWGKGLSVLTGLDHLNGQSVNALVDGAVAGPFTVAGGKITLGSPGVIVQVGLPYNSDMELLDVPADAVKTNVKSVVKATFEVAASRGIYAGESLDKQLDTPQLQSVSDTPGVPPLITGLVGVPIASTWNQGGRACLRQSDPLPLTVIAAIREIVVGGRG